MLTTVRTISSSTTKFCSDCVAVCSGLSECILSRRVACTWTARRSWDDVRDHSNLLVAKSPLTFRTRAPARRSGRSVCQERSCWASGYMQAEVLPEPTHPDDQHARVEAGLGDGEPGRPLALAGRGRMVQLADHDRWRRGVRRHGPAGQLAPTRRSPLRPDPDSPDREDEAPGEQRGNAGRGVMPDGDRPVERRVMVRHEVERGVAARAGERRRDGVAEQGAQRSAEQNASPDPHRATCLPAGIHGRERPRRVRGV